MEVPLWNRTDSELELKRRTMALLLSLPHQQRVHISADIISAEISEMKKTREMSAEKPKEARRETTMQTPVEHRLAKTSTCPLMALQGVSQYQGAHEELTGPEPELQHGTQGSSQETGPATTQFRNRLGPWDGLKWTPKPMVWAQVKPVGDIKTHLCPEDPPQVSFLVAADCRG